MQAGPGQATAAPAGTQDAWAAAASSSWLTDALVYLMVLLPYLSVMCVAMACVYSVISPMPTFLGFAGVAVSVFALAASLLASGGQSAPETQGTWSAGPSAGDLEGLTIVSAVMVYLAALSWQTTKLTLQCAIILCLCAILVGGYGTPYLYRFLHARYRGTYSPRHARQRPGRREDIVGMQFVYILRLAAVLVGRWSPARAHGVIAYCAAAAWSFAAFGKSALVLVVGALPQAV
jgi:hypothetical protein